MRRHRSMLGIALLVAATVAAEEPAAPLDLARLRTQVSAFHTVPAFVAWLKQQPGVTDVRYEPGTLLTTQPPQQWVSFVLGEKRNRLLLTVARDAEVVLVAAE